MGFQKVGTVDTDSEGLKVTMPGFILCSNVVPLLVAENNIALQRETDSGWEMEAGPGGLKTYCTFLIYDTSSSPVEWYDVQIEEPVTETMPDFDRESEFAIIFSDEVNQGNIDDQ